MVQNDHWELFLMDERLYALWPWSWFLFSSHEDSVYKHDLECACPLLRFIYLSLNQWNLIGMCLFFECITGLFEISIALVLWKKNYIGWSYSTWTFFGVFLIHSTCAQHVAATMYFAYVVEKVTKKSYYPHLISIPNSEGTLPWRLFLPKCMYSKEDMFPNQAGIIPFKLLLAELKK